MKKFAFILSFVFVAGLGMNSFATSIIVDNGLNIVVVDNDKKPCPADCTCTGCKEKAANAKSADAKAGNANCGTAKKDCSATKADCKSAEAKKDCSSKEGAAKTPTAEKVKK